MTGPSLVTAAMVTSVKGVLRLPAGFLLLRNDRAEWELPGADRLSAEHVGVGCFGPAELGQIPLPAGYATSIRRAIDAGLLT